jgi:o-succinylbenzoate---CoA ligase
VSEHLGAARRHPAPPGSRELSVFAAAREAGASTALVTAGRELSYLDLAALVTSELIALRRLGLGRPGGPPRVRVTAEASPACVVRLLALVQLGVTVVLLHGRWTAAERSVAVALDPVAWDLDELPVQMKPARLVPLALPSWVPAERALAVVFTSGSAGVPKGVLLSRAAFMASAAASEARLGWQDDDRWLLSLPPAHVGGLSILIRCLLARRAVVLGPGLEPGETLELMERRRVTLASLVAAQLERLLEARPGRAPGSLRAVLLGGGPCPAPLLERAREAGWPVLATYGLTETCSQVATQIPGEALEPGEVAAPPLPGVELRLAGSRILLRGGMLMSGYYPRGRFEEPFTEDGFLDTGDQGFLDGRGRLVVTGRADETIVSGGENVAPAEVEAALLACPGVRHAAVFGVADPTWGHLVAAAIVPADRFDKDALLEHLEAMLAPFKRPRLLALVAELPTTASGKLDRRAAANELAGQLQPFPRPDQKA